MARLIPLAAKVVLVAVMLASLPQTAAVAAGDTSAAPAVRQDAAKSAFESAKELGTADAWNAFLVSYPTGFYADLARAYLKKVGEPSTAPAVTPVPAPTVPEPAAPTVLPPSSGRAAERSCTERNTFRSEHSREPTKITFVNQSGMYRAIMWIDFDGTLKDYGGLNSGEEIVLDTFRTHPWMIATGPGDCLQIFLPAAEPATVRLERLAADDGPVRPEPEIGRAHV